MLGSLTSQRKGRHNFNGQNEQCSRTCFNYQHCRGTSASCLCRTVWVYEPCRSQPSAQSPWLRLWTKTEDSATCSHYEEWAEPASRIFLHLPWSTLSWKIFGNMPVVVSTGHPPKKIHSALLPRCMAAPNLEPTWWIDNGHMAVFCLMERRSMCT